MGPCFSLAWTCGFHLRTGTSLKTRVENMYVGNQCQELLGASLIDVIVVIPHQHFFLHGNMSSSKILQKVLYIMKMFSKVPDIDYLQIFNSIADLQWKVLVHVEHETRPHFNGFPLGCCDCSILFVTGDITTA